MPKLLESFKKRELQLLKRQALNLQYHNFQKRKLDIKTYIIFVKAYKKSDKNMEKPLKYMMPIHFDNKEIEFLHLNFIFHKNDTMNCLPESVREVF